MTKRIRLIIYTDSISPSDVHTFKNAALTVAKVYREKYPKDTTEVAYAASGQDIVTKINSFGKGEIVSLDIVSHGNQGGIHIARKLSTPQKADGLQQIAHVQIRKHSSSPQTPADAEFMEESMHGLYSNAASKLGVAYYYNQTYSSSPDTKMLKDILFDRFAKGSVVEFHGCNTAEVIPVLNVWVKDNFAKDFSDALGENGHVIGHTENSAPNKNPNGNANDYRYGKVRVYKNGALIKDDFERGDLKLDNSSTP